MSVPNHAATFHTFKLITRALGQTMPKQPPRNGSHLLTSRRGKPQWKFISVSKVPTVSCFICFVWVFTKKYNNDINYLCSALSDLPNHDENDHKINQDSPDWRCRSGHECWPLQICTSELKSYVYRSELKCAMKTIGKDFTEKLHTGTSSEVQWLRIWLPMQKTRVWSLIWEDSMCHGATKPECHSVPTTRKDSQREVHTPQQTVAPAHHNERKPEHSNKDPAQPKVN